MMTNEERNQIRVRDRPAACLAEVRQWIAERRECRFTATEQIRAMHCLSEWGAANLLAALIDVLEGDAT
jgi:hypothetical protein